jgi:ABC-2 type transport system ATP-binding protein
VTAIEGVTDVTVEDSTVAVSCATPRAKMPALREIDRIATVADVSIEETSLEDLFEAYTGGKGGPAAGRESGTRPGSGGEGQSGTAGPEVATDGGVRL